MEENSDKSCSTGLSQETAVLLAYLFIWVGGAIFLAMEKKNRHVRFHAMQSLIFSLTATAIVFVLSILAIIPLLGFLISFILKPIIVVAFWIAVILIVVKTNGGESVRLPIIADLADLWLLRLEQRR